MPITVSQRAFPPAYAASSNRSNISVWLDPSLAGILIFSSIGLTLMVLGVVFQVLELPPAYF
jgi:hypothetical protein